MRQLVNWNGEGCVPANTPTFKSIRDQNVV